jgi:hypothetical protein
MILLQVEDMKTLLLSQTVHRAFRNTIARSKGLQRDLWMLPDPFIASAQLNPLILQKIQHFGIGSIHIGSIHIGSIHIGSIHIGSIHIGSIHIGSIHIGSIHIGCVHIGCIHIACIHHDSIKLNSTRLAGIYGSQITISALRLLAKAFLHRPVAGSGSESWRRMLVAQSPNPVVQWQILIREESDFLTAA